MNEDRADEWQPPQDPSTSSAGMNSADPDQARTIIPGDQIDHGNLDDHETILTDLNTVDLQVGQRAILPAVLDTPCDDSMDHVGFNSSLDRMEDGKMGDDQDLNDRKLPAQTTTTDHSSIPQEDHRKLPAKPPTRSTLTPDPDWKGQLESEIGALPSPPTARTAKAAVSAIPDPYWKEEMESEIRAMSNPPRDTPSAPTAAATTTTTRNNTAALEYDNQGRASAAAAAAAAAAATTTTRINTAALEYDNQGRATKRSMIQDTSTTGRVGAFPQPGPARHQPAPRVVPVLEEGRVEMDEQSNMDGDDVPQESPMEAHVTPVDSSTTPLWKRKPFMVGAVLLFLMVVVAVVTPLVISKNAGGTAMSKEETAPPTIAQSLYIAPVPNLSNSTLAAIEVEFSVPYEAFHFVSRDPYWNFYEDWRKQQRFAMACIFYAIMGWMPYSSSTLYLQHECEWVTTFNLRCPGGEEGIVKVIELTAVGDGGGHIPPEVALLPHLEVLSIMNSWLVDMEWILPLDVPNSLPSLKDLSIVDCGDKNQGTIPSKLGLLTSLTKLDLSDNKLVSTIPSELGLLSNLTSLILVDNLLSGTIPEESGHLASLVNFEADGNSALEPVIPSGFCSTNHTDKWRSMKTDWCSGPTQCCDT